MAIRQRKWVTKGKVRSAWVVDYIDAKGVRRLKTFGTKREADDWRSGTRIELKQGTHVADRDSITVAEAGKLWIATCEANELERGTRQLYQQYLDLHIGPRIGAKKLNELTVPAIRAFQDRLRADGRSLYLTNKILTHLGSLLADAMERGLATRNPVRERKRRAKAAERHQELLAVGVHIPTPGEVRAVLGAATGFRRAIFATAAMTGLRASELRGLAWRDVDFAAATITVRQRADKWGTIGSPKAAASRRTIPLPPLVVSALKEWKLACPRRDTGRKDADGKPTTELHLVFPNGKGRVEMLRNITRRHWHPLQVAAGVSVPVLDDDGRPVMAVDDEGQPLLDDAGKPVPVMAPKYSGLHALRHFFCSWCAARPQDGGLGLPLKTVQHRMGHSTLAMTADRYGHLFPSTDDAEILAAGERALMSPGGSDATEGDPRAPRHVVSF
jgi:integrase